MQLAADQGVTLDPNKGTVVVDTRRVTAASVRGSAIVGELNVTLYDPQGGLLEASFAVSNGLVVFFNIAPGTVTVKATRDGEVLYSESHAVAAGMRAEVRARPKGSTGGGDPLTVSGWATGSRSTSWAMTTTASGTPIVRMASGLPP